MNKRVLCEFTVKVENLLTEEGVGVVLERCYAPDGGYIGELTAGRIAWCKEYGVQPQKAKPEDTACSIGWQEDKARWWAWGAAASHWFAEGIEILDGVCDVIGVPWNTAPKNDEQAKEFAIIFAEKVARAGTVV